MLSYTKAVLDYNLTTQLYENEKKLIKIKAYIPSDNLLDWRETVAEVRGQPTSTQAEFGRFIRALEAEVKGTGVIVVTKTMNNRYKLAGDYCIRLYYGDGLHLPADPDIIKEGNAKKFVQTYREILNAHSVSKRYVNKLCTKIVVLSDEY